MKKYFISIYLIITIIGCQNHEYKINFGENLDKFKEYFYPKLNENFSEYSSENLFVVFYPVGLYVDGYCGVFFKYSYDKVEFDSIALKLENASIFKSKIQDTSKYYIPNYKIDGPVDKFPIPNLNHSVKPLVDSLSTTHRNYLYILKKEKGRFFNKKGIDEINKFFKSDYKEAIGKGFSKGAIVDYDNREIVYWVIIW